VHRDYVAKLAVGQVRRRRRGRKKRRRRGST
jgi:hypothetical protein